MKKCRQCGKEFDCYAGTDWAYTAPALKQGGRRCYFCSYSCQQKHLKEREANKKRGKKKSIESETD